MGQPRGPLLDVRERLTPADHQTHRHYRFAVPKGTEAVKIHVGYAPKSVGSEASRALRGRALAQQTEAIGAKLGEGPAERWGREIQEREAPGEVVNLLTISLDDAAGAYRGACHRQAAEQDLFVNRETASPGLCPGDLPEGEWTLTLSAHTLASTQCEVWIQIGAETASSTP